MEKTETEYLEDGERIIGYKSRILMPGIAYHGDFRLIIGRLVWTGFMKMMAKRSYE